MKLFSGGEFTAAALAMICALAFTACEDEYEPNPLAFYWLVGGFQNLNSGQYIPERNELEDLGDGTVRFTMTPRQYRYANTMAPLREYSVLLGKCPRGFVYAAGTNTCMLDPALGGSDPALAKLQYCSQANNGCNDLDAHINAGGVSEMYTACANDATADLSWRPAYHYTLKRLVKHEQFESIYPDLKAKWIFAELAASTDSAYVFRSDVGDGTRPKTDRNFVLCEYVLSGHFPSR